MKIRIKDDSVRFRLTKSEVKALGEEGKIEALTHFNTAVFGYVVVLDADASQLYAEFKYQKIILFLPEKLGKNWFREDRVGFEHFQKINQNRTLHLLLEKDFTCLDNTLEDQSDNYPNPKLQPNP
ncbi:MAG: hypothetical protein AAGF96_04185 [Bacteroidota bacterium]